VGVKAEQSGSQLTTIDGAIICLRQRDETNVGLTLYVQSVTIFRHRKVLHQLPPRSGKFKKRNRPPNTDFTIYDFNTKDWG
jgi:hypothetical protein